ncbi:MAG: isopeptide-forming domain-containing fimbrial protein, partial [Acidobacteria bacterium]|nr:isopeptide-forming domain-containing fimbrial protein [Acidobacteriota bacterium]
MEKRTTSAVLRTVTMAVFAVIAFVMPAVRTSAQICAVPGKDGPQTISGVVNSYYPAPTSATASGTSIPVGAISNLSSSLTPIESGDLLLIIQVQDAQINSSNNNNYGAGNGTGRGFTSANAGYYEYVVAANSVGTGGGTITTLQSLSRTYRSANATSSRGRRTYQVVRIPQYSAATISGTVSAASWDGTSGGIVAFDVAGTLNMGGGTINANGRGFRGGLGISLTGGSGSSTDYRGTSTSDTGGSKGEGIAGTPRYIWDGSLGIDNGTEGYPNGSFLRGAPGNAGGGGTDGSPSVDNGQNSGGGGGGNGGIGGTGGNSWSSNLTIGGIGGDVLSASANRLVFGGGGGAGTTNNGADETSSGGLGGGIVILRVGGISGSGTITANGANAPNSNPTCCGDGAGGGG